MKTRHVLLLNPWIYDFAAHSLWIEPLGLLTIAAVLVECGYEVTLLDCLAPHPAGPPPRRDGSGKFLKTRVDKPEPVAFVPRQYGRYGLPLAAFKAALAAAPSPDLVMVTSTMTYWYPGVLDVIARVRDRFGVHDFAFYDDALLLEASQHLVPILEGVLAQNLQPLRFHTPNGLHAGQVTPELAALMHRAGFATVRLSLETADPHRQRASGAKVATEDVVQAVAHLQGAGFGPSQVGVYVLAGLPDQPLSEVEATIRFVHHLGVQAKLALFSPIPGTPDGDRALPEGTDPLLHNNTVRPYLRGADYAHEVQRLKHRVQAGNAALV